jgi:predicted nucleotidyltransferase
LITKKKLNRAIEICKENGVTRIVLFGSAAKNLHEARDIDLGVEGISGWDALSLAGKIENEIGVNVDIVDISKESDFIDHIKRYGKLVYA